jgi:aminoglycoside phosphotransferase (APT) family kinase protein
MVKKYFSLDENFDKMIENALPGKKINSVNPVSTGWTNIVFEVSTDDGNYFFRFPRDDFWIRTIVKDCEFAEFVHGKTDFNTVDLKLQKDNSRAFSVHKKIEGKALTEKMDSLNQEEVKQVSMEIAKFMYQLHNVKYEKNQIFKTDDIGLNLVDFLDELIELHLKKEDKKFWKYQEFSQKDNTCLVHGDLNPGNIILDENNHISAVIDFGFGGFGNKYFDIARIIGRLPSCYKPEIISSYESLQNQKLDYEKLENEIKIWNDIDSGYIRYMKSIGIC